MTPIAPDPDCQNWLAMHDMGCSLILLKTAGKVMADKTCNADRIRASLLEKGAFANIPPKASRPKTSKEA